VLLLGMPLLERLHIPFDIKALLLALEEVLILLLLKT